MSKVHGARKLHISVYWRKSVLSAQVDMKITALLQNPESAGRALSA
jgi:hypothetical protein